MVIKPIIRSNVFLTAHPIGCFEHAMEQFYEAKRLPSFKGPKEVLIIGGSSGYGFASRVALTIAGGANTINVSYESGPKAERSGTAGYWHNLAFEKLVKDLPSIHRDFLGDAFSAQMKQQVIEHMIQTGRKIDLVIYSIAAGARFDEQRQETIRSHIKTIGEPIVGKTIDIATKSVKEITVTGGTEQEVKDTVFVMGGSDWADWIHRLDDAGVLATGVKTISYTYIGSDSTARIYRDGTIGQAKEHLEQTALDMNPLLQKKYRGEALISSSKAVVTKASVFIPQMPIYVSCLIEVMSKHGVHEAILEHKYRLFKDMVYGDKRLVDDKGRIRIDHQEMDPSIQREVVNMMKNLTDEQLLALDGTKRFLSEFYQIHGFGYPNIDYEQPVVIEE
ncbi:MAG TPA: enoyl-[acyl-carrier-protein] reductase FabV [Bacilli bacterium]|nr:enoyl-[acyl-carrier-protein] reductase FabV [Bacilli bacterium]